MGNTWWASSARKCQELPGQTGYRGGGDRREDPRPGGWGALLSGAGNPALRQDPCRETLARGVLRQPAGADRSAAHSPRCLPTGHLEAAGCLWQLGSGAVQPGGYPFCDGLPGHWCGGAGALLVDRADRRGPLATPQRNGPPPAGR